VIQQVSRTPKPGQKCAPEAGARQRTCPQNDTHVYNVAPPSHEAEVPPMKLYFFPVAPNPTRVRLCIAEKAEAGTRIDLEEVMVNLPQGEQKSAEHQARNPLGRLPVLELDDGSFLTESLAIIEYFEELHPEPSMIGRDPLERARVRELERLADLGLLARVARIMHATRSPLPGVEPNAGVAEEARSGLPELIAALDARVGDSPFAAGPTPTIADCTLFASFKLAEMAKIELPTGPNLKRWFESFSQRPSAEA
jgi:glutathione S-transferase